MSNQSRGTPHILSLAVVSEISWLRSAWCTPQQCGCDLKSRYRVDYHSRISTSLGAVVWVFANFSTWIDINTCGRASQISNPQKIPFCVNFGCEAIWISLELLFMTDIDTLELSVVLTHFVNSISSVLMLLSCRFYVLVLASESVCNAFSRSDNVMTSEIRAMGRTR